MAKGKTIHAEFEREVTRFSTLVTEGNTVTVDVETNFKGKTFSLKPGVSIFSMFSFENQRVGSYAPAVGRLITAASEFAEKLLKNNNLEGGK